MLRVSQGEASLKEDMRANLKTNVAGCLPSSPTLRQSSQTYLRYHSGMLKMKEKDLAEAKDGQVVPASATRK
jgi:hypothetical protein